MTPAFRGIDSSQAVLNGPGLGLSHARHLSIIDPVPPHQLCSWCIPSPCINVRLGLEITLQALMPTPVQLSTVGQPLVQGNHKLHVIEVPYRLRAAHSKAMIICWNQHFMHCFGAYIERYIHVISDLCIYPSLLQILPIDDSHIICNWHTLCINYSWHRDKLPPFVYRWHHIMFP